MFKLLIMKGIKYKYLELKDLDNGGFFTFKPNSKTLKYCITDSRGRILKNSHDLENLINKINWKKL